jgi:hypothetical protein
MNNYTMATADSDTHLKIVVVSLTLAIVAVWLGMVIFE